jgi:hypothetical protein
MHFSTSQIHSFGFMHVSRSFHSSLPTSGFYKTNTTLENLPKFKFQERKWWGNRNFLSSSIQMIYHNTVPTK